MAGTCAFAEVFMRIRTSGCFSLKAENMLISPLDTVISQPPMSTLSSKSAVEERLSMAR